MTAAQKSHNPFVICRAAAGSGKTFTLVKEYLKLAMAVPSAAVRRDRVAFERLLRRQFAGILAITFTNKAAGEMKSRIMEYLERIVRYGTDAKRSRMGAPQIAQGFSLLYFSLFSSEYLKWPCSGRYRSLIRLQF